MKINIIIQARMSSTRFPGKMLYEIQGKPLLQYLIESMQKCKTTDGLIVATSHLPSDDPIEEFCISVGAQCFRGRLNNVAERFNRCIDAYPCNAFVRVCGDSPLLDWRIVDRLVQIYRGKNPEGKEFDLVTNVGCPTTPAGQHAEVVNSDTFDRELVWWMSDEQREHVTKVFYDNEEFYDIFRVITKPLRMVVDTEKDMKRFQEWIEILGTEPYNFNYREMVAKCL
ncbi:MAG: hypothetical protein GY841_16355 [FCB group bacterium]|nr:hypothetical protein [FCB group bacterium]